MRVSQSWEHSDGALYLLRELTGVYPQKSLECVDRAWRLLRIGEFEDRSKFRTSLFQIIPEIFKRLNRKGYETRSLGGSSSVSVNTSGTSDIVQGAKAAVIPAEEAPPRSPFAVTVGEAPSAKAGDAVDASVSTSAASSGGGVGISISRLSLGRARKHKDQSDPVVRFSSSAAKQCIEECSGVIVEALLSDYPLEASAAAEFSREMAAIIGPSIMSQKIPVEYRDAITKVVTATASVPEDRWPIPGGPGHFA